ncbi:MAG TPA: hypothetical protein VKP08_20680 [Anaerolineales bacterium]|nr:hypothetical protein [Anaerolineales bacterium]
MKRRRSNLSYDFLTQTPSEIASLHASSPGQANTVPPLSASGSQHLHQVHTAPAGRCRGVLV